MTRRQLLIAPAAALLAARAWAQSGDWVCPMDPDIHMSGPGKCPRCGMTLTRRVVEPITFDLTLTTEPAAAVAGRPVDLVFRMTDPRTHTAVTRFETIHEKLFHLFLVRQDLSWFLHDHPLLEPGGVFRLRTTLPAGGMYAVFADLYPSGATPQWLPRFLFTQGALPGGLGDTGLTKDVGPQRDGDVQVTLAMDPVDLWAGRKSILQFEVQPGDGLEPWLGAAAHALWVKDDLMDAEHTHPAVAGALEFHVYFPRPGTYRFWLQFMRRGTLHTVHFTLPVRG